MCCDVCMAQLLVRMGKLSALFGVFKGARALGSWIAVDALYDSRYAHDLSLARKRASQAVQDVRRSGKLRLPSRMCVHHAG